MRIADLVKIETELLDDLRKRAAAGDNHAAQVALEHLRETSRSIEDWRKGLDYEKRRKLSKDSPQPEGPPT